MIYDGIIYFHLNKESKLLKNKSYKLENSYPKSYYILRGEDITQATQEFAFSAGC